MAIPGDAETLERLLIEVVGDDSNLKTVLDEAVKAAQKAAAEMRDSLNLDWSKVTQGAQQAATAFDTVAPAVKDVNATFDQFVTGSQRAFDDVRRAGRMTTEQFEAYRKTALEAIETQRPLAQSLGYTSSALDDLAKHVREAAYEQSRAARETERTKQEQEELEDVIKRLSNEVRSSRNVWAGRITSDEEFRQSTGAARDELLKLLPTLDRGSTEYRKLTQELAYAQRGLDSVNKVASRGGLAWTAQIALANQFGQQLRGLGPAGNIAAGGLGLLSTGFANLQRPLTAADFQLSKIGASLLRLPGLIGLASAALTVGLGVALGRITTQAAQYARELENATFRTGLTVEGLQELQHAARSTGVPLDLLSTTMQRLQRRAADANAGNEGLRKSFQQLGVTLTDNEGRMRTTEDLLGQVADGLNRVESDAERLALAFKVFDTEGGRLLPLLAEGSEGIRELREEARELGLVISGDTILSLSQFQAELETIKQQFEVLKTEIAAAFLPVMRDLLIPLISDRLIPALQSVVSWVDEFSASFFDTTEAGEVFRADMLKNLQAVELLTKGVLAGMAAVSGGVQFILGIGAGAVGAGEGLRRYVDTSEEEMQEIVRARQHFINTIEEQERQLALITSGETYGMSAERVEEWRERVEATLENAREGLREFETKYPRSVMEAIAGGWDAGAESLIAGAERSFRAAWGIIDADTEQLLTEWAQGAAPLSKRSGRRVGEALSNELMDGLTSGATQEALEGSLAWISERLSEAQAELQNAVGIDAQVAAQNAINHWNAVRDAILETIAAMTEVKKPTPIGLTSVMPTAGEMPTVTLASPEALAGLSRATQLYLGFVDSLRSGRREAAAATEAFHLLLAEGVSMGDALAFASKAGITVGLAAPEVRAVVTEAVALGTGLEGVTAVLPETIDLTNALGVGAKRTAADILAWREETARITAEWAEANLAAYAFEQRLRGINDIGVPLDTIGQNINALTADLMSGRITLEQYTEAMAALRAAQGRLNDASLGEWLTTINQIGRAAPTELEAAEAALQALEAAGVDAGEAFEALEAARERLKINELDDQLEQAASTLRDLAGDAPTAFEALRGTLETVRDSLIAMGEDASLVTGLLEDLGELEGLAKADAAAEALAERLGEISGWLHQIGSAAGGELGEAISGLGDMVGIAQKFASNDVAGAVVDVISEIVGAIASVINANKEWERSLDKLGQRYQLLSDETVRALAVSRSEAVKLFGWIPIGSKRVIDEDATATATQYAVSFGTTLESALKSTDFKVDFELGIDKLIQQELIEGFILGTEVQAALIAFQAAMESGDYDLARSIFAGVEADAEAFWAMMKTEFPELYEMLDDGTGRAKALADALRTTADNVARLGAETAGSELARAFDLGTISLGEYRDALNQAAIAEAHLAREQAQRALQGRRDEALKGLEGEERESAAESFQLEADAIDRRFNESVTEAERGATDAIKNILALTTSGLTDNLRSAFDVSTFSEFTASFGDSMHDTVRNALVAGFLESSAIKPLLDELGTLIADSIADGTFDAATKAAIGLQIDLITSNTEEFFNWLNEIGYGFRTLDADMASLSDSVRNATDSMLNVPQLFKVTQATWDAAPPQVWTPGGSSIGSDNRPPLVVNVSVGGDVVGIDDFGQFVEDSVRRGQDLSNLSTLGLGV